MLNRHLKKVSRCKIRDVNTVNSVMNWKALVGTINPEMALDCENFAEGLFAALVQAVRWLGAAACLGPSQDS